MCERTHSNTLPPKPLSGISAALDLLAVRQGAAATTAKLQYQPRVNAPLGVNVKLNCTASARPVKDIPVKGA